jgi:hypothetical protein
VLSKPGVFGNSGLNVLPGPGAATIDFMLGKRFRIPWEGRALQFRFEAFNFTNTPRFGQPVGFLGSTQTGTIARLRSRDGFSSD